MKFLLARAVVLLTTFAQHTQCADPENFQLEALAITGPYRNSGLFLGSYHVGAGENAAVAIRNQSYGDTFKYNSTGKSIHTKLGEYQYFLDFAGTLYVGEPESYPNKSYFPMGINIEQPYNGFTFNSVNLLKIDSTAPGFPSDFKALAICHNNKIDGIAGSGQQLFYRFGTPSPRCSDVNLKAIV